MIVNRSKCGHGKESEKMSVLVFFIDKIAGAIVTLPLMLLFLFFADKKRFSKKWGWVVLFAVYMNAMLVVVGVPDFRYITFAPTINWIPFHDFSNSNKLGMVLNIVMFIPFGAFLPIYFKEFRKLVPAITAGFLMSLAIELLQLFTFRATDVDDLVMNTIGAAVGYGIAQLIFCKKYRSEKANKDIKILVVMISISIVVVVFIHSRITELIWPVFLN